MFTNDELNGHAISSFAAAVFSVSFLFGTYHSYRACKARSRQVNRRPNIGSVEYVLEFRRDTIVYCFYVAALSLLQMFFQWSYSTAQECCLSHAFNTAMYQISNLFLFRAYLQQLSAADISLSFTYSRKCLSIASPLAFTIMSLGGIFPLLLRTECTVDREESDTCFFHPKSLHGTSIMAIFTLCLSATIALLFGFVFIGIWWISRGRAMEKFNFSRMVCFGLCMAAKLGANAFFLAMLLVDGEQNVDNWLLISLIACMLNILSINAPWQDQLCNWKNAQEKEPVQQVLEFKSWGHNPSKMLSISKTSEIKTTTVTIQDKEREVFHLEEVELGD
uniref:Uncharacterized protein n=1 Tax=Lotharella oceanica TaxID=641309 RepID=A0A7S2TQT2_9EUKA|mmetsp:Transcript_25705/g.47987  ORF Transcript_25705/g.47987 Transcript_25705/m.47987 type:complete len:334 (+) Transcript_25705:68-1069(+)